MTKKSIRKAQIAQYIKTNRNEHIGYHESSYHRLTRLLSSFMRPNPLYDMKGNLKDIVTLRAYWMKYNRQEIRRILNAIRSNRIEWQRQTFKQNGQGFMYLSDIKQNPLYSLTPTKDIVTFINQVN